jgi:hypothetical protein
MKENKLKNKKSIVVSIIPTGIKCEIGGFIGDATQITNLLASACDYLITNPNAIHAGAFNFKAPNVLCIEGFAIDLFFKNKIGFKLTKKNKIGIIIEKIPDKISLKMTLKTIEAFSVVAGVNVIKIEFIKPLKKRIYRINKQFAGEILNIDPILQAGKNLKKKGATALAITTYIPAKLKDIVMYQKAKVPNPYGLLEALISHSLVKYLKIPSAHAPLLTKEEMDFFLFRSFSSDKRTACENISPSYLGSVLISLNDAPQIVENSEKADIALSDVEALIVPENCFRSIPVAFAIKNQIPVIEVRENKNIFSSLTHFEFLKTENIFSVRDYRKAYEIIQQLKLRERKCAKNKD